VTDEQSTTSPRRRVPYFERPPHPRDWRFWVGGLGRLLVVSGLLVFGFVAYQLWGTGIQTARAQHTLRGEFAQSLATNSTTTTTVASTTLPTSSEAGTTTTTLPPFPLADRVSLGQPMARLEIPSISLDYVVVEGVRVRDLQRGPGHFPESQQPGQRGNVAFACHRTTYGAPCYDLDHVAVGDLIRVTTKAGVYVYRATGSEVVSPSEYRRVVPTLDRNISTLAITTCTPIGTAQSRLVLRATLDAELSGTIFSAAAPTNTTTTVATPTTSAAGVSTTTVATTASSIPTTTDPLGSLSGNDTFAQGWFERPSLITQCVVWAAILIAIVTASYLIGRRFRRLWVCFAVGAIPFLLTLYFFFENLNLLLPASI
jgi:sortase A